MLRNAIKKYRVVLVLTIIALAVVFVLRPSVPESAPQRLSCRPTDLDQDLNCTQLLSDKIYAKSLENWKSRDQWTESGVLELVQDRCRKLRQHFCFQTDPLTQEEDRFPLAYIFIVSQRPEQLLRLLEAVYWPQNLYCFTYDMKASPEFKNFIENLAGCFPNIVIPKVHEKIFWGTVEVLQAAVNCLHILNLHPNKWRYVQILTATDFPLKTNWEMVQIFKIFNGANDAELKAGQAGRYSHHVEHIQEGMVAPEHYVRDWMVPGMQGKFYIDRHKPKPPPPGNLTVYKGSFAATMSRAFVGFVTREPVPRELLDWLRDTMIPDEEYWSSLIHNTHIGAPGAFPGSCLSAYTQHRGKTWISRYQAWPGEDQCNGKWNHGSCVFGIGDLANLVARPELVAHKLHLDFQPAAYWCLRRWHHASLTNRSLHLDYYRGLPAVKYQNRLKGLDFQCT